MRLSKRALIVSAAGGLALPILPLLFLAHACSLDGFATAGSTASSGPGPVAEMASSSSAGAGGGQAECPHEMTKIEARRGAGTNFCIDRLEVTRGDYAAFAKSVDGGVAYPEVCAWKNGNITTPSPTPPSLPVSNVDWCDAYAYCAFRGKRLCGNNLGGTLPLESRQNLTDQWYAACTDNALRQYPYGDDYKAGICADCNPATGCVADPDPAADGGADAGDAAPTHAPAPTDAGASPNCVTKTGVYDLSGNVAEWEDACNPYTDSSGKRRPDQDTCSARGGSYKYPNHSNSTSCLACGTFCGSTRQKRYIRQDDIGVRCCKDLD